MEGARCLDIQIHFHVSGIWLLADNSVQPSISKLLSLALALIFTYIKTNGATDLISHNSFFYFRLFGISVTSKVSSVRTACCTLEHLHRLILLPRADALITVIPLEWIDFDTKCCPFLILLYPGEKYSLEWLDVWERNKKDYFQSCFSIIFLYADVSNIVPLQIKLNSKGLIFSVGLLLASVFLTVSVPTACVITHSI